MDNPLKIIGIYSLPFDEAMVVEQAENYCGDGDHAALARRLFESTVLVEVLVSDADIAVDVNEFSQGDPHQPRGNWQAPWCEVFLSSDGERVRAESDARKGNDGPYRIAFYIHHWRPGEPLLSNRGPLASPAPSPMPERLRRLAPYQLVD